MVGGVGYVVHTPAGLTDGDEVRLIVETVVRADAIVLYGFADRASHDLFVALIKVPGVGPSSALSLLATVGARAILDAIADANPAVLRAARGVGDKAARAIIAGLNVSGISVNEDDDEIRDLTTTLVSLGWPADRAASVARGAVREVAEGSESERVRWALNRLRSEHA